ncbi:predicted protein [Naegleria gruberi]|uniref:Predicted protein n=1 Tax=Naegleria gruberi TaxID=5762 RepID=D2VLH9_NAEGR|nr:uncharacterized protein NAEGRDRAFT_69785 [Naegleria gruberi]EFC42389.1 predicted protein [Naegleria gruberi]|eukprot:XP_002675133.1 predicted protein [Naegleria gruberi strain NEG-M]
MLSKRTRREDSCDHSESDDRYLPPVGKQRKIISETNRLLHEIDSDVFSEHILKYLDNLEVIRFSLVSTRCREIFRNYQARVREFLFVMERFTEGETRVIFRECKTIICVNCGFKFSNMLNYESNVVNMSIYGEIEGAKEELITFLTLCKFNNLRTLVLQALALNYEDFRHILDSNFIDLLKKNLRLLDVMNNRTGYIGYLFDSFHPDFKIVVGSFSFWESDKNKYYYCFNRLHLHSYFDVATFFYSNKDFQDYKKAFHFFTLASENEPKAYEFIGYMYYKGRYVAKDYKTAFENYLKGAEDVPNCTLNVAMAFENGHGVEKDWVQAYDYYRKAANQNNVRAIKKMARGYQEGVPLVLPQDFKTAIYYYRILERFEKEEAHFQIGHIYEVCLNNFKSAASYFEKHLNNSNFLYRYTRVSKRAKDQNGFEKGMEIYRKEFEILRDSGNKTDLVKKEDGHNQINFTDPMLDTLYFIGILDANNGLLQLLFDNISEKTTDIITKLGDFYRSDQFFANGEDAKRFYEAGVSRGNKNAIFGLAFMCISGVKGKFKDLEAAIKFTSLFLQTNEQSYLFKLGLEYFYEKHYTQAMECLTKTKDTYPEAQYYISYIEGYYFEKGKGGYKQNVYRAIDYYKASCTPNFLIPFGYYKCGKLACKQKYHDLAFTVLKPLVAQCQANPSSPLYIYIMACLYQGGYYLDTNQMEAIKLFETSAKMGYERAGKTYKRVLEKLNNSITSNYF